MIPAVAFLELSLDRTRHSGNMAAFFPACTLHTAAAWHGMAVAGAANSIAGASYGSGRLQTRL